MAKALGGCAAGVATEATRPTVTALSDGRARATHRMIEYLAGEMRSLGVKDAVPLLEAAKLALEDWAARREAPATGRLETLEVRSGDR